MEIYKEWTLKRGLCNPAYGEAEGFGGSIPHMQEAPSVKSTIVNLRITTYNQMSAL